MNLTDTLGTASLISRNHIKGDKNQTAILPIEASEE